MTTLCCAILPEDRDVLYEQLYARATPGRQQRAHRYLRKADGLRCLAAGELLSKAVQQALNLTEFTETADSGEKPRICGQDSFHYNLSHSGNRVAIAWGDSPVGVDVQQMHGTVNKEELAKRFFTPQEQAYIFEQPELTHTRFYQVWTGKESYLKYLGTGLKKSLTSFSIFSAEIAPMLKTRYLPGGYCISLCSRDTEYIFELDSQFFDH